MANRPAKGQTTSRMQAPDARLLPALPRARDWHAAGVCAGLLLGLAELFSLERWAPSLSPRAALCFLSAAVVAVSLPTSLFALGLTAPERRLQHSELVGGMLGPLLFAPSLGLLFQWFAHGSSFPPVLVLLFSAGLSAVAGMGASRIGGRLEQSGCWLSGPIVWGLVAWLIAGAEEFLQRGRLLPFFATSSALAAAGIVYTAWLRQRVRRETLRPPWPWSRTLAVLTLIAVAWIFRERALPWLLLDRELTPTPAAPGNVLLLAFDPGTLAPLFPAISPANGAASHSAESISLSLLATDSVRYAHVELDAISVSSPVAALLTLPNQGPLLEELAFRGFATAAFLANPKALPPEGAEKSDRRPGTYALLSQHARYTAGGGFLLGIGPRMFQKLSLGFETRSPDLLSTDAQDWLFRWRTRRAHVPFFLIVDYMGTSSASRDSELAAQVERWLRQLDNLGLSENTLLLVAAPRRTDKKLPTSAAKAELQLVARLPYAAESRARGERKEKPVAASRFAEAVALAVLADPPQLPQLPES